MLTLDKITNLVSKKTNVRKDCILSKSRIADYVAARCLAVHIAYDSSQFTKEQLMEYFGKSRTMLQTYIDAFKQYVRDEKFYYDTYLEICKQLGIEATLQEKPKRQPTLEDKITSKKSYKQPICEYSVLEELKIEAAIRDANEFMKNYGKGHKSGRIVNDKAAYC